MFRCKPSSASYTVLHPGVPQSQPVARLSATHATSPKTFHVPSVIIHVDALKVTDHYVRNYRLPVDPMWEVCHSSVQLGRQIGAGAFAVVYAGTVCNASRVLPGLKRLRSQAKGQWPSAATSNSTDVITVAVKTLKGNHNSTCVYIYIL